MEKINKKAAEVFNTLIAKMNGEQHLRIGEYGETIMPVCIEILQPDVNLAGRLSTIYALAHYFKMNGDLVPDPDMTFAVSQVNPEMIWPLTYQDQMRYQEAVWLEDNVWKQNKVLQSDLASFASQWLVNIKNQRL